MTMNYEETMSTKDNSSNGAVGTALTLGGVSLGLSALNALNSGNGGILGTILGTNRNTNDAVTPAVVGALAGSMWNGNGMSVAPHNNCMIPSENRCVDRHELEVQMNYEKELAEQRLKIAELNTDVKLRDANTYTDSKISDVFERLYKRIEERYDQNGARIGACEGAIAQQAVYNATNSATIGCIQNQVAQLQSLTALKIPNTSVCPGWGNVSITPA